MRSDDAAEEANHHPDLDLRYPFLAVKLVSHDVGGVTSRDLELAGRISELAAAAGVAADTSSLKVLELALDTASSPGDPPVLGGRARLGRRTATPRR